MLDQSAQVVSAASAAAHVRAERIPGGDDRSSSFHALDSIVGAVPTFRDDQLQPPGSWRVPRPRVRRRSFSRVSKRSVVQRGRMGGLFGS